MTYCVSSGTLNPTHSLTHSSYAGDRLIATTDAEDLSFPIDLARQICSVKHLRLLLCLCVKVDSDRYRWKSKGDEPNMEGTGKFNEQEAELPQR